MQPPLPTLKVEALILTVRGQNVIIDSDLARIYGVQPEARPNDQERGHVVVPSRASSSRSSSSLTLYVSFGVRSRLLLTEAH